MNIRETMELDSLRTFVAPIKQQTKSSRMMVDEIFNCAFVQGRDLDATKSEWIEKNVSSSRFTLMEIPVNRVANPGRKILAGAAKLKVVFGGADPIVIDYNKNGIGRVEALGFKPRAIVIDGKEKFAFNVESGITKILAWVGDRVLTEVHACSATCGCGMKAAGKTKKVAGVDLTSDCFAHVGDKDDPSTWKLPIKFPGDPEKTKRHVRNALSRFSQTKDMSSDEKARAHGKIKQAAKHHGVDVQSAANKCMQGTCLNFSKEGRVITLKDAIQLHTGMKGGKRSKIQAVSPPGFEKTVAHMKDHKEISNPYALSWSMYDKGFQPHAGKSGKK